MTASPKTDHARFLLLEVASLKPSPENNNLYRPVRPDDPEIVKLAASIRQRGLLTPLVVTADLYIVSGHRRHAAAKVAGLEQVLCEVLNLRHDDDPDEYVRLLREHNRQREKTLAERTREAVVDADPYEAYRALLKDRGERERGDDNTAGLVVIRGTLTRSRISDAKRPMLDAVLRVLDGLRKYWPLSDRQIHYALLNDPPLRHASKPKSLYRNDAKSYNDLTDLLTRGRVAGDIPMHAIDDETRPVSLWRLYPEPGAFIAEQLDRLLKGFRRDYQQSQPHHLEVVGEKNTVQSTLKPVCGRFGIPLTIARGYPSLPVRAKIAKRYKASGKGKLILLVASDFDPEGEDIPHSLARSLRDDFGIEAVEARKVALTAEQVRQMALPLNTSAKTSSSRFKRFAQQHGRGVYELEAMTPRQLQDALTRSIDSAIDADAFNAELDAERGDAHYLERVRIAAHEAIGDAADLLDEGGEQ